MLKNFVLFAPGLCSALLTKDPVIIPLILKKYYNYNSYIIGHGVDMIYPEAEKYLDNMKIKVIYSEQLDDELRNIDILMVTGFYDFNISVVNRYKELRPNGLVYMKTDFNIHWLNSIIHTPLVLDSLSNIDILSVETKKLHEIMSSLLPCKVEYLTNGYYDFSQRNNFVDFNQKENTIITVGRIGSYEKASDTLINAFALIGHLIPSWNLKLVGEATPEIINLVNSIKASNPSVGNRIEFTGKIDDKSVLKDIYEKAKIFCLPSRFEGFPNVFAEAAYNGCYIVASNLFCSYDITDSGKYGSIFEIDNISELSEILLQVCNDETRLKDTCNNIQVFARENFNWIKICEALDKLILKQSLTDNN